MLDSLETILRQCAEAAPSPWYPSAYARTRGIPRDDLDPDLDRLRMAGLIHLTDWVQGQGQGYALTPDGEHVLQTPRELARLRAGQRVTVVAREDTVLYSLKKADFLTAMSASSSFGDQLRNVFFKRQ